MDNIERDQTIDQTTPEQRAYWDEDSYVRIDRAAYDAGSGELIVSFRDGDELRLPARQLLRPEDRQVQWDHLEVVDYYYLHIPARPEPIEVPGFTIRAITDPIFAAHLAREAEESLLAGVPMPWILNASPMISRTRWRGSRLA